MYKQNVVYPIRGVLFIHIKNEVLIYATTQNENIMPREKPEIKVCLLNDSCLFGMSRIGKSVETESRLVLPGAEGQRGWKLLLSGYRVSVRLMKKCSTVESDDYTTV